MWALSNFEDLEKFAPDRTGLAMKRKPSVDFSGYWQRHEMKEANRN